MWSMPHWQTIPQSDFPVSTFPDASGHQWIISGWNWTTAAYVENLQIIQCVTAATSRQCHASSTRAPWPTKFDGGPQRLHTAAKAAYVIWHLDTYDNSKNQPLCRPEWSSLATHVSRAQRRWHGRRWESRCLCTSADLWHVLFHSLVEPPLNPAQHHICTHRCIRRQNAIAIDMTSPAVNA